LIYGAGKNKGIRFDGLKPVIVDIGNVYTAEDLWIHDEKDLYKAQSLIRMFDDPGQETHFPRPFGVFYESQRDCYEDLLNAQVQEVVRTKGKGNLNKLLTGRETWTINP
jgi:2-oxoglutarate ferredoxin oxidoreductase subunit beta